MPISISSSASSKIDWPVLGCVAVFMATASVAMLLLNRSAMATDLVEVHAGLGGRAGDLVQRNAAHQAAAVGGRGVGAGRDVLVREDHADVQALLLGHLHGHVGAHHVAGVVEHDQQHAGRAIGLLQRLEDLRRAGAAKMSPTTLISSMPSPTKPLSAGSCPAPPSVTRATLSWGLGWARTTSLPDSRRILSGVGQSRNLPAVRPSDWPDR